VKKRREGCKPGCSECCGIVLCNKDEYDRIAAYAKKRGILPIKQGSLCPWHQGGKCAVYQVRPLMCILFGHVTGLLCPEPEAHFTRMGPCEDARIMEAYRKKQGQPMFIHEVCFGIKEIRTLLEQEGVKLTPTA
jgi:Fe-S-cluster containining protein